MDEKKTLMKLVELFAPDDIGDSEFQQYLADHTDTFFDDYSINELFDSLRQEIQNHYYRAYDDYRFLKDTAHPMHLDTKERRIHFGECDVSVYWYDESISKKELEETLLRYKRIWEKLDYGEIIYPLLQDWHPLAEWRKHYSESILSKMEQDLEAGTDDEAMRLYYTYARRGSIWELERVYPDKIAEILSVINRMDTKEGQMADLHILLRDGSECSVRIKANKDGRPYSTTTLMDRGFPMFTDADTRLIQKTVFCQEQNSMEAKGDAPQ